MDMLQGGRGVVRVRNTPIMSGGEPVWYSVCAERVAWKDFRHQPENDWSNVNWCAFRHYLDRDQLEELNPADGAKVRLDHTVAAEDTAGSYGKTQGPTDVFKRAAVWEVWDKRTRRCLFIAPSWKKRPLKIEDDPLRLEQFFPVAPPIWADKDPDSMVPLPDFRLYEDLASELDEITRRIQALIRVCKWRGIYNSAMGMIASLESADDGDLKPVDMVDPTVSLDNYVWLMPVERVAEVLQQLYLQRKEILGTIYEITGLSDIIRGNTDPSETLGSQRIKAQWASGKLSTRQGDVARLCRDIIRLKAEIIVEHWPPEVLSAMTGIMVTPPIAQLLTSDQLRMWRIDVETDSTIQADLTDARENIGQLIEGTGRFITAIAPAVQGGLVSKAEAIKLLAAFSKPFRLGRSAEQVFDEMVAKAEQEAQQPPQPPPPDPKMLEVQATDAREREKMQLDMEYKAAMLQLERDKAGVDPGTIAARNAGAQSDIQLAQARIPFEAQKMQFELAKHQSDLAERKAEAFAAERSRQADADRQRLEIEAFTATKRAEIIKAETDVAIAEASARKADEIAKAKAQIELQALADKAALARREQLAIAEDARRRREIDEKAYLRIKEAEIVDIEAKAAASRAQSLSVSTEVTAKQEMMALEIEKLRGENEMMRAGSQSDIDTRAQEPARQEEDARRFDALAEVMRQQAEMLQTLVSVVAAPKMVVRDNDGIIVGTRTVLQ